MTQITLTHTELETQRKNLLDTYRKKQPLRVAVGKSPWVQYEEFNASYNLREILNDEIVIEFDMPKDYFGGIKAFQNEVSYPAINFTALNLWNAGYSFEIWEHGGKSPHLHIHNLPIGHFEQTQRTKFKKLFIKKYVPEEFFKWVDLTLTGVHLIALEYSNHWKGRYSVKLLLNKWNQEEKNETKRASN